MFKRYFYAFVLIFFVILKMNVSAAIPVAVMPFEGEKASQDAEKKVRELLGKSSGITVVAQKMMGEIIKVHQNAQVVGSENLDLSKIKAAEFLITGSVSEGKLVLKAVDVNEGTEVYNETIELTGDSKRLVAKAVKDMSDKILFKNSSKSGDVPSEAKPYMDVLNKLAASMGGDDASSYPYIAIYLSGAYNHPDGGNKKAVENAKLMLRVMRPYLLRSKLYYISMKGENVWVYLEVVAEKTGKKTKLKIGVIELADGSLGVGLFEEIK